MPQSRADFPQRSVLIKLVGALVAAGLHLAVLGAILASPPVAPEIDLPETVEVRFVEIAPEVTDTVANPETAEPATPDTLPEIPEPDYEQAPEPVFEPEPEPEPVEEPEPEPVVEPEPEPVVEPVAEPEPETIQEPVVPPKVEPKPEPKPKPKPKPQPKPKPKPKPVAKPAPPKPAPVEIPAIKPADVPSPPSGRAQTAATPKAPSAPVDPERPRMIGKVDYMGRRPSPAYPRMSQRRGEQGRVIVRVLISPQGSVLDASVRKTSGFTRLDEAAMKAARTARFKPYTENGIAYKAMADIPFDFVL